ncbi:nuclear pore complex protein NUP1 [Amborella trichopoda]|uniref:nuclear pore complex protein NUP1 n=1 Tax=Amborella trichopoda TaxID=13333 RepID=UPI0009BF5872|nr:nuclear pore complex protein NUP1 [Amborella trichopoda]|eukprot:XP_020521428.1 nuclear pore complex protein NUP1 [Amborella trichopoda]
MEVEVIREKVGDPNNSTSIDAAWDQLDGRNSLDSILSGANLEHHSGAVDAIVCQRLGVVAARLQLVVPNDQVIEPSGVERMGGSGYLPLNSRGFAQFNVEGGTGNLRAKTKNSIYIRPWHFNLIIYLFSCFEANQEDSSNAPQVFPHKFSSGVTDERVGAGEKQSDILKSDGHAEHKLGSGHDGNGLAKLEKLLNQKTFSRDQFNRLSELLRSRMIDHSNDDGYRGENKNSLEVGEPILPQNDLRTSKQEKRKDLCNRMSGNLSESRPSVQGKEAVLFNKSVGNMASNIVAPEISEEIRASPIKIAKAYMENKLSTPSSSCTKIFKDERNLPYSGALEPRSLSLSLLSKSPPTCWPGALGRDQHGYLTPPTQRGRVEFHSMACTPYSRGDYTTATPNGSLDGNHRCAPLSHWRQPQTPLSGGGQKMQVSKRGSLLDDGRGSFGPIRRTRQKLISNAGFDGSRPSIPASPFPDPMCSLGFGATKSSLTNIEEGRQLESLKGGVKSSHAVDNRGKVSRATSAFVLPKSRMARTILEHCDRKVPSPKEKLAELELVMTKENNKEDTKGRDHTGVSNEQLQAQRAPQLCSPGISSSLFTTRGEEEPADSSKMCGTLFAFPIPPARSACYEEPPTPTLPPTFSVTKSIQANKETAPLLFQFCTKSDDKGLVFCFGSNDKAAIDYSTPKFNFGSANKPLLSFSSAGVAAQTKPNAVLEKEHGGTFASQRGATSLLGMSSASTSNPLFSTYGSKAPSYLNSSNCSLVSSVVSDTLTGCDGNCPFILGNTAASTLATSAFSSVSDISASKIPSKASVATSPPFAINGTTAITGASSSSTADVNGPQKTTNISCLGTRGGPLFGFSTSSNNLILGSDGKANSLTTPVFGGAFAFGGSSAHGTSKPFTYGSSSTLGGASSSSSPSQSILFAPSSKSSKMMVPSKNPNSEMPTSMHSQPSNSIFGSSRIEAPSPPTFTQAGCRPDFSSPELLPRGGGDKSALKVIKISQAKRMQRR